MRKGEFVVVRSLPDCCLCDRIDGPVHKARFDLAAVHGTSWGDVCAEHRAGKPLGTGRGQLLVLPGEDPDAVLASL